MPQIQPKSSLQAKNVPWPENGASAVVEGRRPGRDWCRWRTVPGTYTGTGTHWQCLVPPCVPGDLECARFIASRASAILASSSMAARPNATERQLISLFRAQALHPKHTGAAITLRVLGTKFSIPALKVFKDEFSCQEWISLYFWQKFTNGGFQQSLSFTSSSFYMGWEWWVKRMIP